MHECVSHLRQHGRNCGPLRVMRFMRSSSHMKRRVLVAAVAAVLVGVGYGATESAISSTFETSPRYPQTTEEEAASQVLGAPVPRLTWVPAGLVRSALTLDPEPEPIGNLPMPRFVYQSFSITFENVALLRVNRGRLGRVGGGELVTAGGARVSVPSPERVRVGSVDALVQTGRLPDGAEMVTYYIERSGLVLQFDVKLARGLDRQTADRMFASIR